MMQRRVWMCVLGGGVWMAAAGCAAQREPVTMVTPTYTYLDDADAPPIVWTPPVHEERTVAAMMAEADTRAANPER